jgi:hypothetical protein
LNTLDDVLQAYQRQIGLPWVADSPPAARVWIVWYDKSFQRRFTLRLAEFEQMTVRAGHGWRRFDASPWLGRWLAGHEFFEALAGQPRELRGLLPDIESDLIIDLRAALANCSANDVLAVDGCGSLFGITRISNLLNRVAVHVPGRLLLGFPGTHRAGVYRLLDARDGWNYHATPIPSENAF